MSRTLPMTLLRAALLASLALPATALLPAASPFVAVKAFAGTLAEQHKTVLAQYGKFEQHAKYGEVWVPTVTPQGWHPYPACNWIYTKYGWYFDDKTEWGAIVHHHGRWTHEAGRGWMWVPGEEFSPGWVVWKANEQWVGWAPTPPDEDMKSLDSQAFNTDKMWTFMETRFFGKSCGGGIAPVAQVPTLLTQTKYIRDVVFVDGVLVFVFPTWLVGPIVDIDIFVNIWSPIFIVNIVNNWNIVWNINININIACVQEPVPAKIISNPPKPPGRRSEGPPAGNPDPGRPSGNPDPGRPRGGVDPKKPNVVVDWLPPGGHRPRPEGGRPNGGGGEHGGRGGGKPSGGEHGGRGSGVTIGKGIDLKFGQGGGRLSQGGGTVVRGAGSGLRMSSHGGTRLR
jgi:hypothetical protein